MKIENCRNQCVQAVLFDLDGTLLDTVQDLGACANVALKQYGFPEHKIEDYRRRVGHGIRRLFQLSVAGGSQASKFEEALQFYLSYYPKHCTEQTVCFPGIPEMVGALKQGGYKLAVITNKTEVTAQNMIRHYFPDIPFQFVWGNNGSRPLKPAADAGRLACEELKLNPEQVLYFGDGDTDMQFGKNIGFVTVGCAWGYRSKEQLLAAGAELIVEQPSELLQYLSVAGC